MILRMQEMVNSEREEAEVERELEKLNPKPTIKSEEQIKLEAEYSRLLDIF